MNRSLILIGIGATVAVLLIAGVAVAAFVVTRIDAPVAAPLNVFGPSDESHIVVTGARVGEHSFAWAGGAGDKLQVSLFNSGTTGVASNNAVDAYGVQINSEPLKTNAIPNDGQTHVVTWNVGRSYTYTGENGTDISATVTCTSTDV